MPILETVLIGYGIFVGVQGLALGTTLWARRQFLSLRDQGAGWRVVAAVDDADVDDEVEQLVVEDVRGRNSPAMVENSLISRAQLLIEDVGSSSSEDEDLVMINQLVIPHQVVAEQRDPYWWEVIGRYFVKKQTRTRRRYSPKFVAVCTVQAKNRFGVMERNTANFMVVRRFIGDLMAEHGMRPTHISIHLDMAVEAFFVPSIHQLEAQRFRRTQAAQHRIYEGERSRTAVFARVPLPSR